MRCNIPIHDLGQRLNGTICLYKNIPYKVTTEAETDKIYLCDLVETKKVIFIISSKDPDFDVATPPLGYCQVSETVCLFISRLPNRRFKQGLFPDYCLAETIPNTKIKVSTYFSFYSHPCRNMIMKKYPSFDEQKSFIKDNKNIECFLRAYNNDIAFEVTPNIINVFFRQEQVGFITRKSFENSSRPIIYVPSSPQAWIVSKYLDHFEFEIQ